MHSLLGIASAYKILSSDLLSFKASSNIYHLVQFLYLCQNVLINDAQHTIYLACFFFNSLTHKISPNLEPIKIIFLSTYIYVLCCTKLLKPIHERCYISGVFK